MGRRLGQHILKSNNIRDKIVFISDRDKKNITVLEIGPGKGFLTEALLKQYKKVVAIEKDSDFFILLKEKFNKEIASGHLELLNSDIRDLDIKSLNQKYKVIANIPYYITSQILEIFLSSATKPSSMTLMVQKEVAERIAKDKKESILSLSVKIYGKVEYCGIVQKRNFSPPPKVDSAILHIDVSDKPPSLIFEKEYFNLIKQAFRYKRKQLKNLIPDKIYKILLANGVAENSRAEDIPYSVWKDSIDQHLRN